MIDPIKPMTPDMTERAEFVRRTTTLSAKREASGASNGQPRVQAAKPKDSATLSLDLTGDLDSLRKAVSTVFGEVRQQLEATAAFRRAEENAAPYLPPEGASADEILSFFGPKNTAQRIAGFATGFFEAYLNNRGKSLDEGAPGQKDVDEFAALVTKGIQQGFKEAEAILGDFEGLGRIGENIQRTYDLVLEEIATFRERFIQEFQPASDDLSEEAPDGEAIAAADYLDEFYPLGNNPEDRNDGENPLEPEMEDIRPDPADMDDIQFINRPQSRGEGEIPFLIRPPRAEDPPFPIRTGMEPAVSGARTNANPLENRGERPER